MEEQHVNEVIVAFDIEVNLPTNERETRPEFPEGFGDSVSQGLFQIPFGKSPDKPRNSKSFPCPVHDHVQQDIAGPSVLNCGTGIPNPDAVECLPCPKER
ncbi:hypothetical protein [Paenarthrobacter aurescens]|uniref:hypothetical protein n=1 Tax=Paenarthrobacter aurescens TaxID=43663 RepID=UPI00356411A4